MEIVKLFVEMGASPVDPTDDPYNSPLCNASRVWPLLVILQIEINCEFVILLLLCAFQSGHLEIVEFLVANGATDFDLALFFANQVLLLLWCFFCKVFKKRRYLIALWCNLYVGWASSSCCIFGRMWRECELCLLRSIPAIRCGWEPKIGFGWVSCHQWS